MEIAQLIDGIEKIYLSYGYQLIFVSSLIEISPIGWAIPGGLVLALGGFYAYSGGLPLLGVLVSGFLGTLTTFLIAYFLGKKTGYKVARRWGQEENAKKARRLLEKHGPVILTTSLMAGLTRFWVAYIAGAQKYHFLRYLFYSSAASLTWVSLLVSVGYLTGTERSLLESWLGRLGILSWILVIVALFIIYWKAKKEFDEFKEED